MVVPRRAALGLLVALLAGLPAPATSAAAGLPLPPPSLPALTPLPALPGLPLEPVCGEPFGQTDTPPHPRVQRAVVGGMPVAVVLPPGYERSRTRYPVVYLMHGAQGDEDSWIEYGDLLASTAARSPREQAIVVLPRLGAVTGLAVDWVDGHRRDATLIGRDLVRWVDSTYRTRADRQHRALAGYSGGGLSAAHLAEVHADDFGQLGVLSGAVAPRDPANQLGVLATMRAEQLCAGDDPLAAGPLGDPVAHAAAWEAVDPLHDAGRLRGTTVFLSSGNGVPCRPEDAADLVYPTAGTEPQLRQQTQAFSDALTAAGVRHTHQLRSCGLHWWTTWTPDLDAFWDLAAAQWRGR